MAFKIVCYLWSLPKYYCFSGKGELYMHTNAACADGLS